MPENKGFWKPLVGEYVTVYTATRQFKGKLESTNFDTSTLNPSFVDERFEKGTMGECHMGEGPFPIDNRDIVGIQPSTKKHLDEVCEFYSRENIQNKNRRIITP